MMGKVGRESVEGKLMVIVRLLATCTDDEREQLIAALRALYPAPKGVA